MAAAREPERRTQAIDDCWTQIEIENLLKQQLAFTQVSIQETEDNQYAGTGVREGRTCQIDIKQVRGGIACNWSDGAGGEGSFRFGNSVTHEQHDQTDPSWVAKDPVQIDEIREATTRQQGRIVYLELPSGDLQWSHREEGKSGYFYFQAISPNDGRWEFAASDEAEIEAFHDRPLTANFSGAYSPNPDKRFGSTWADTIDVKVGQIVLARLAQEPTTIYIIKLKQQEEREQLMVKHAVVQTK